jgi:hypothetical protein
MDLSQARYFSRHLATFCLTVSALMFASAASATLIGDSLEYDGHVKSGAAIGVEQHAVAPAFPPSSFTLPVTNGPLAAPLQPAHALTGSETEYLDSYNSLSVQHVVITIQAASAVDNVFVNPLDPGIALPVFFDGTFHTTLANKKVTIQHIGIENIPSSFSPPFPNPGSSVITGLGTAASPLHVQVNLAASQVSPGRGALKLHLYYTTSTVPVPEPSTLLMLITGGLGMIGVAARRRG